MNAKDLRQRGFTLIELLVVVAVIAILVAVLLPALNSVRTQAQQTSNAVNVRSMMQGLVAYADTNDGWYTGIDGNSRTWKAKWRGYDLITRDTMGSFPSVRFSEFLTEDLVTADVLIHPTERDPKEPWRDQPDETGEVPEFDYRHYSYAMPELGWDDTDPAYTEAQREWRVDGTPRTPVLSDRLYSIDGGFSNQWNPETYVGMFGQTPGDFRVAIGWNDGHVSWTDTAVLTNTRLGRYNIRRDNIFARGEESADSVGGAWIDDGKPNIVPEPLTADERQRGSSIKMNAWEWDSYMPVE